MQELSPFLTRAGCYHCVRPFPASGGRPSTQFVHFDLALRHSRARLYTEADRTQGFQVSERITAEDQKICLAADIEASDAAVRKECFAGIEYDT